VDLLPRGGKIMEALVANGYRDLRDVPVKRLTHEMHRRVFDATESGLAFFDLVDLLPVTRAAYYHRDMRGSWSIKSVMPTIDAKLGYAFG